jgi:hypothetical protein
VGFEPTGAQVLSIRRHSGALAGHLAVLKAHITIQPAVAGVYTRPLAAWLPHQPRNVDLSALGEPPSTLLQLGQSPAYEYVRSRW